MIPSPQTRATKRGCEKYDVGVVESLNLRSLQTQLTVFVVPRQYKLLYLAAVEGIGGNDLAKFRMTVYTREVDAWDSADDDGKGALEYPATNDGPHGAPLVSEEWGSLANYEERGLDDNEFGTYFCPSA